MEASKSSSQPNFNDLELKILEFWEENKIFEKSLERTRDGEPFIFYDGPPFATGLPHYGSILPSVIKDAIPRFQTMQGRSVRRRWGWDCHGLPIENLIEQQLGISGKKAIEEYGIANFNQACRDNVLKYVSEWGKTIKRIARWVDFENSYKTMDTAYMESVWWAVREFWNQGLIYEDRKVLLYCPRCETPISNFEVAMDNSYRDISENSVFVKFKLLPRQRIKEFLVDDNTYMLAWTTTPWTLPGNTALNIGKDIVYVLVREKSASPVSLKYILAKEKLHLLSEDYEVITELNSVNLEGLAYEPLYVEFIEKFFELANRAHRIYAADFVTVTDGTGIVHNAAMYGEEDYLFAKEKHLPREPMLNPQGEFLDFFGELLRGKFFLDANRVIIEDLKNRGLLFKTQVYLHSYPFCWRCGTQLYYNAIPAWFINIQKIKTGLLENNTAISWYPAHLKNGRFKLGIENAPDWNISRNRYWATALPFWKCEATTCGHIICIGSIGDLEANSINFAEVYPNYKADLETNSDLAYLNLDLHRPYIDRVLLKCDKCGGVARRISEVIDCWVESGGMPFAELHFPFENQDLFKQRFPSDFVVEYIPQTRAWFYVMHVMSSVLFGRAPFKNVVTTGTILAEDGAKMSKSKKNYPDPNWIIEKYGADALRFYLLTSPVINGEDINFSEKGVEEVGKKLNLLLYNVWSFFRIYTRDSYMNIERPEPGGVLDSWAMEEISRVNVLVKESLNNFDTVKAGRVLLEWVNDFSTWYVRRSRERLKIGGSTSQQSLRVYAYLLKETAKCLAPLAPYLSEFIYRDVTGELSVHLTDWSDVRVELSGLLTEMSIVREVVSLGHALRKQIGVSVRQPLAAFAYVLKNSEHELSEELLQIIKEELNVRSVSKTADGFSDSVSLNGGGIVSRVSLDRALSSDLKVEGLARELERQVQDLRKKSGLQVGDLVDLYYNTKDPLLESAVLEKFDRRKTFVSQIQMSFEVEADFETQAEIGDQGIWLGLVRI